MKYKIGDVVKARDRSYSFGIEGGKYSDGVPYCEPVTVIKTDLTVMEQANRGRYTAICDLLVTDGNENYWFTASRFCSLANDIEIRYFSNGEDVTDKISDETKRNLTT